MNPGTRHALRLALLFGCTLGAVACSDEDVERRARAAAEKMRDSIPDVHANAMAQKLSPEEIREVQEQLTAIHEYMGEINGVLDAVTVNAIQAFERSQGLQDDGILDRKTRRLLAQAASKAPAAQVPESDRGA